MSKSRVVNGTPVEKEMKQKPKLQFKKRNTLHKLDNYYSIGGKAVSSN